MTESAAADSSWGFTPQAAVCERCDWSFLLPPDALLPRCPHCFQAELTLLPNLPDGSAAGVPELIVPFSVASSAIASQVRAFAQGIPFAPADLTPQNLEKRMQRVFLPVWLVDASVKASWEMEAGYNYEVVSHQERYSDSRGGWGSQEVRETRIRWEPRLGNLDRTYPNVRLPALDDFPHLEASLGEYESTSAVPFSPSVFLPASLRLPQRSQQDAWPAALPALQGLAARDCQAACGADHTRQFRWSPEFTRQNWTLLLLPVLTTYYLDDDRGLQRLALHGQSGRLSGSRRASFKRARRTSMIFLLIAAILFVVGLLLGVAGVALPPLLALGGFLLAAALVLGLGAVIPPVVVWSFNRSQAAQNPPRH
jgi:hypothetical protein